MNEILIYGDIGWENTARSIEDQLKEFNGEPVNVRINSGGGDVYEGVAILNALRGYAGEVTTVVESLAASAASFIAAGVGGRVVIRPNAELMIHKAWTVLMGNADDIERSKADLARQDVKIAKIYAERAGGELDDWLGCMSDETWYDADEAVAAGLVDAVEDAKKPSAALADAGTSKIFAQFKYRGRSSAPPPKIAGSRSASVPEPTNMPSDGQGGEAMSFLNKLAQSVGMTPEEVQNELSGFFNEKVTVSGEVDVTYPADNPIVPTEKITVEPVIGDAPAEGEDASGDPAPAQNAVGDGDGGAAAGLGLTFEIGDVPDGWTASVEAESGVVTVKAPSGAEIGETVEIPVTVNDTAVPLTLKVRGLSEDDEEATGDGEPPASAPANAVTVDRHTYNELVEGNREWAKVRAERAQNARHARVDGWIQEGRISASARDEAIKVIDRDEKLAEDIYGSRDTNTVPRREIGNVGSGESQSKVESLIAKANANRKNRK